MFKKSVSILISAALIWSSGGVVDASLAAPDVFASPSNIPQFQLQPPGQYGRIVDYFNATVQSNGNKGAIKNSAISNDATPLVILIQDLHAHYGVQKNIVALLDFLNNALLSRHPNRAVPITPSIPFALAVEG